MSNKYAWPAAAIVAVLMFPLIVGYPLWLLHRNPTLTAPKAQLVAAQVQAATKQEKMERAEPFDDPDPQIQALIKKAAANQAWSGQPIDPVAAVAFLKTKPRAIGERNREVLPGTDKTEDQLAREILLQADTLGLDMTIAFAARDLCVARPGSDTHDPIECAESRTKRIKETLRNRGLMSAQ